MGTVTCRACQGRGWFMSKSGKKFDCRACGGTGTNKDLWSTRCERCQTQIIYKAYTTTPRFCKDCRNIELTKNCAQMGCNNTIHYKVGWTNVPTYCKRCETKRQQGWTSSTCPGTGLWGCGKLIWSPPGKHFKLCQDCNNRQRAEEEAKWREKPCAGGCGTMIRYNVDWEHQPNFCKSCKEKQKSAPREKVFWPADKPLPASDRSLNDLRSKGVNGVSVKKNGYGGYHVTLFTREDRYSYDTDASGNFVQKSAHLTDEAAKLLGKDTIGSDSTNRNRW